MKSIIKYILSLVLLSVIAFICYLFFFASWPGDTVSDREITSGSVGQYVIGDSKEELMSKNKNGAFSPAPKPEECPQNWIYVNQISSREQSCLINSSEWSADSETQQLCGKKEDYHVTLYFLSDHLSRIRIRCSLAI